MDTSRYEKWVEKYIVAWNSNDAEDIKSLFTEDGRYFTEPYATPWSGRDEIVRGWLDQKDEPGDTEFSYDIIAVEGDLGILKGRTVYKKPPREYVNLWEIMLGSDDRATQFVEWWMKVPED